MQIDFPDTTGYGLELEAVRTRERSGSLPPKSRAEGAAVGVSPPGNLPTILTKEIDGLTLLVSRSIRIRFSYDTRQELGCDTKQLCSNGLL